MALRDLSWFSYEDKKWNLMNLVKDNTYKIIPTSKVVKFLPNKLGNYILENDFAEYHVAIKIVDEKSAGTMTFFNINRIDETRGIYEIDQDQWFLAWHYGKSEPSPSGALFSHGTWDGRTEPIDVPKPWIRHVLDSGLNERIPISTLPIKPEGSIEELDGTSHWRAREELQAWLKPKKF